MSRKILLILSLSLAILGVTAANFVADVDSDFDLDIFKRQDDDVETVLEDDDQADPALEAYDYANQGPINNDVEATNTIEKRSHHRGHGGRVGQHGYRYTDHGHRRPYNNNGHRRPIYFNGK